MRLGKYQRMLGVLGVVMVMVLGCAESPMFMQRMLGKEVGDQRQAGGEEWCPQITTFTVSPVTVQCGGEVSLEIAAVAQSVDPLTYSWDIEGQTFESGQRAIWKTPTVKTIGDPEKTYTVRGIVTAGQCSVTRAVDVTVLCSSAFDVMVHFAFGKSYLDATAKTELDEIAKKLQEAPQYSVLIDGHADYIGSDQANKRLGQRRAEAVKAYLAKTWGIAPERIMTRTFGEDQPIAPNETDIGRAKNRRAELFRVRLSTK